MGVVLSEIRKSKWTKVISSLVALGIVQSIVAPTAALALTSGPAQPEFTSFEPVESSNMVDLFSGDFTYNIPLFELPGPNGGYPFNIAYQSGISMEQEASWVGLGWNINPGVINRNVSGIPDDFDADLEESDPSRRDYIQVKKRMLTNHTIGIGADMTVELIGADASKGWPLKHGVGLGVYYNNYRGMGYSYGTNARLGLGNGSPVGVGASLSLDSQEGVGMNASLSYEKKVEKEGKFRETEFGLGLGFHSQRGLNLSANMKSNRSKKKSNTASASASFSINGADAGVPSVNVGTRTVGLNVSLSEGVELGGFDTKIKMSGYWRGTYLQEQYKDKYYYPLGFNNYQSKDDQTISGGVMMDYTRHNEGVLTRNTSNLPTPQMTNDMYSVSGQGVGGVFRAHRNSFSHLSKNSASSKTNSGAFGFDMAAGSISKIGFEGSYSYGRSSSGRWENKNGLLHKFTSKTDVANHDFEPFYFKFQGERTTYTPTEKDAIGGESPYSPIITTSKGLKPRHSVHANKFKKDNSGNTIYINDFYKSQARKPRSSNIQHYINAEMIDYNHTDNDHIPGEYQVDFYDLEGGNAMGDWLASSKGTANFNTPQGNIIQEKLDHATIYKKNHLGGFSILKENGNRYVYGIPVYNTTKVEATFSTPSENNCAFNTSSLNMNGNALDYEVMNSKKMLNKTTTSSFAQSYLITSILGADYVDLDAVPGPSDGDMGYWVKFNYARVDDNFQWRAPFTNARYQPGFENDTELVDDMGSYQYGKKEMYYVVSVETSSHIAVFDLEDRTDAYGANGEYNTSNNSTVIDAASKSYQLSKIDLYAKKEFTEGNQVPIKTVHFDYDYSLCQGILNSAASANNNGKLTLKNISFTYGNNARASISPYGFEYNDSNPNYNDSHMDRWGNYQQPIGHLANVGSCATNQYSYVNQFNDLEDQTPANKETFKNNVVNANASAWHLTTINMPSGGKIEVDYESDDYAYVQHRKATQMFRILGVGAVGDTDVSGVATHQRKLLFKLEYPIAQNDALKQSKLERYFKPLKRNGEYQLFFRTRIDLRNGLWQNVSGWATFQLSDVGLVAANSSGDHTMGYVMIDPALMPDNSSDYNPIEVAGMGHLRMNQPELMSTSNAPTIIDSSTKSAKAKAIKGLSSFYYSVMKMFRNFYKYCRQRGFASRIDLSSSYMRLATPDGVKYGGGVRVKSVEVHDNWNLMSASNNENGVYGQYYDYTIYDEDFGSRISSGVAANEPMIGGEENALKYVKRYGQSMQPFSGANNLFFEYPINMAYYPGASVGYRKVSVMSKNTYEELNSTSPNDVLAATGVVEHEFYTAKEFPVIARETPITKGRWIKYSIPILFIGQLEVDKMAFGQGYSIEVNDMHGKPKSQKSYSVAANRTYKENEISSTYYDYQKEELYLDDVKVYALKNEVTTLDQEYDFTSNSMPKSQRILGEDYEFFMESNENRSTHTMGGVSSDVDVFPFGILPAVTPSFWPSASRTVMQENYAVTNKVIYKTGVLNEVVSKDKHAVVNVKNEYYDALTGGALVVSTTNKYHDGGAPLKTYQYNIPAHWMYDRMGAAYKNFGFKFNATTTAAVAGTNPTTDGYTFGLSTSAIKNHSNVAMSATELYDKLVEGDELILALPSYKYKATLIEKGEDLSECVFHSYDNLSAKAYDFIIARSGRRNQLDAMVGSTVSFTDPIENGVRTTVSNGGPNYNVYELLTEFLMSKLDCEGKLQEGTFDLFLDRFDTQTGEVLYPEFSSIYKNVTIGATTGTNPDYVVTVKGKSSTVDFSINFAQGNTISNIVGSSSGLTLVYDYGASTATATMNGSGVSSIANAQTFVQQEKVLSSSAMLYRDHWPPLNCENCGSVSSTAQKTQYSTANPYATGEKGIYRPAVDYYYDAYRTQTTGMNLKEDGVYYNSELSTSNETFYPYNWTPDTDHPNHSFWKVNSKTTQYNAKGFVVETRDALGISSSAKYGYNGMLPVIVGQNIEHCDLFSINGDDVDEQVSMADYSGYLEVVDGISHTGNKSLRKKSTTTHSYVELKSKNFKAGKHYVLSAWGSNGYGQSNHPLVKDYQLSNNSTAWQGVPVAVELVFEDASGNALLYNGSVQKIYPSGNKIDQWQRFEGEFIVPNNTVKVGFRFELPADYDSNEDEGFFWDDLRIYPVGSLVKTSVYDQQTLRLLGALDENNYSVQYIYDESGNLYSTRVETPNGIMSVNETMSKTRN